MAKTDAKPKAEKVKDTKKKKTKKKRTFAKGDRVEWSAHGGTTRSKGKAVGTVVRKVTKKMTIKGHTVKASKDEPQYLVESDNGGRAAHKPSALRRSKAKKGKKKKAGKKS